MNSDEIRCSHILQKHSESRRPFDSYRNKQVTRSPEEAMKNIVKFREEIVKAGLDSFGTYAEKYSECGSAKNNGDLGFFGKGQMQSAFEKAAFALKKGDMSEPVSTDSGIHIILRLA